jgi:hypothetical protein
MCISTYRFYYWLKHLTYPSQKKIKTEVAGKGADPAILPSPKRHAK